MLRHINRPGLASAVLALALAGCPTPPTAYESTGSTTSTTAQGASTTDSSGQQSQQQGQQGMLDLSQTTAQKSQDEIKAGEHVTISGTVSGTCKGKIRIDVISAAPPQPGSPMGPLTTAELAATGAYSLVVPTGTSARMTALCDNDGDSKIENGTDGMSKPTEFSEAKTDQKDINLTLEDIPTQPTAMGGGGGQMGGMGGGGQMGGGQQMMGGGQSSGGR